jgi:hypothetical protein
VPARARAPNEEVVHHVRRCASRLHHAPAPLEVTIEPHRYGFRVKLEGAAPSYPVI